MKLNELRELCPRCGGPAFSDSILAEKKDACYYKVKASAKVWPSAYASGRLVQCRKKGAANYGNKSESIDEAGNPAQQAAIAIAKKKSGQYNKDGKRIHEEWSKKYKSSINCSHPKGFSQKAHCAGKKKHNESIEQAIMEMTCPDCGMCQTHIGDQNLHEACWKGYHKEGNKELFGKTVPNCVKNEDKENNMDELSRILELGTGLSTQARAELHEEFDLIESIIEGVAGHNGVDTDVIWEDLESLTDDELYVFAVTTPIMESEAWQKANKKDKTDGMSQKAVNSYRREHPGSKLKTAVTTKPSKLKKGSKASKRRKSYCSRSRGQMKMHSISCAKTPDKAICKARRRWNC